MKSPTLFTLPVIPANLSRFEHKTWKLPALEIPQPTHPRQLRFGSQDSFEKNSDDSSDTRISFQRGVPYPPSEESLVEQKKQLRAARSSSPSWLAGTIDTDQQLRTAISAALKEDSANADWVTSRFLTSKNKLFSPPQQENLFHERLPELNSLPVFYSTVDTEIADNDSLQKLPPKQKAAASTRLIAKRFVDAETGFSFYEDAKKGNPLLHEQSKPIREIRTQAAAKTLDAYRGHYIHNLYKHLMEKIDFPKQNNGPIVVHLVRPGRNLVTSDATVNYLSLVAQREVTDSLNYLAKVYKDSDRIQFSNIKQFPVLSRTARSNASPLGRIVQQGYYDTAQIKANDMVVIVDDHTQAGATVLSMAAAMSSKGAKVLAAIMPTVHPYSSQLSLSPKVKKLLQDTLSTWDTQQHLQQKLQSFGMPLETLTDHEAMIIIAYATNPENKSALQKFSQLAEELFNGRTVAEGDSDSLKPVLQQNPLPVEEIIAEMDAEIARSRRVTQPLHIKSVHVMDWDDFLRDEKGLNYQLMHNAISVSAQRYGEKHPFLKQLNDALTAKRGSYSPEKGMPLLSMSQNQFANTTIRNTSFLKRDALDDLLTSLDGLKPGLQATSNDVSTEKNSKNPINNIIWHEFRRQYQAAIQPNKNLHGTSDESLPFPIVRPTLMPGARSLLERKRRPDKFIALISNRPHGDLEKEINKMGLMHYFDSVQGTPQKLTELDGKASLTNPKYKKPDPHRLQKLIDRYPELEQAKKWHFWGDTTKDITQVIPLLEAQKFPLQTIHGTLVNPGPKVQDSIHQAVEASNISQRIKIRTTNSLETLY